MGVDDRAVVVILTFPKTVDTLNLIIKEEEAKQAAAAEKAATKPPDQSKDELVVISETNGEELPGGKVPRTSVVSHDPNENKLTIITEKHAIEHQKEVVKMATLPNGVNLPSAIAPKTLEIPTTIQLVPVVTHCLKKWGITVPPFTDCTNGSLQLIMPLHKNTQEIINDLTSIGIGEQFGSLVVSPYEFARISIEEDADESSIRKSVMVDSDTGKKKNVAFIMRVEKIMSDTTASAQWTVEYVMYIITAGLLAGAGLLTNNSVILVASMLVSPMMGPILAITFGLLIQDRQLIWLGFINTLKTCLLCIIIGIPVGWMAYPLAEYLDLPNTEMTSRGHPDSLLVGLAIAIPSGVGVALAVTSSNTSGLVGVAISASLLPPAVNCGLLWGMAMIAAWAGEVDKSNTRGDLVLLGTYSMCLTLINIACIIIFAGIVAKVKHIAQVNTDSANFWSNLTENVVEEVKGKSDKRKQQRKYNSKKLSRQKTMVYLRPRKGVRRKLNSLSRQKSIWQKDNKGNLYVDFGNGSAKNKFKVSGSPYSINLKTSMKIKPKPPMTLHVPTQ